MFHSWPSPPPSSPNRMVERNFREELLRGRISQRHTGNVDVVCLDLNGNFFIKNSHNSIKIISRPRSGWKTVEKSPKAGLSWFEIHWEPTNQSETNWGQSSIYWARNCQKSCPLRKSTWNFNREKQSNRQIWEKIPEDLDRIIRSFSHLNSAAQ